MPDWEVVMHINQNDLKYPWPQPGTPRIEPIDPWGGYEPYRTKTVTSIQDLFKQQDNMKYKDIKEAMDLMDKVKDKESPVYKKLEELVLSLIQAEMPGIVDLNKAL